MILISCSQLQGAGKAILIEKGWTANDGGFFLSESVMRQAVTGWKTDRELSEIRLKTINDLKREIMISSQESETLLENLKKELKRERAEYNKKIRSSKTKGLIAGLVTGVIVGICVSR